VHARTARPEVEDSHGVTCCKSIGNVGIARSLLSSSWRLHARRGSAALGQRVVHGVPGVGMVEASWDTVAGSWPCTLVSTRRRGGLLTTAVGQGRVGGWTGVQIHLLARSLVDDGLIADRQPAEHG
jgi:hypothetical protein